MTVRELIEQLETMPPNDPVNVAMDIDPSWIEDECNSLEGQVESVSYTHADHVRLVVA